MTDTEVTLHTYPASGNKSAEVGLTVGPDSGGFTLIINANTEEGKIDVIVGNGPDDDKLPEEMPIILAELSELFASLTEQEITELPDTPKVAYIN